MTLVGSLAEAVAAVVGAARLRTHPLDLHLYRKDAGITSGEASVIAFPESASEVAELVRIAGRMDVPVVARGAGTGLAGGAVPQDQALVLVMTRMNRIDVVDAENRTALVEPGVINLDLSRHTAPLRLHFAPDPSSQAACTIGGNVGNNSGGPHCLAEGSTVNHVLAVEYVDTDGNLVRVGGPAPDPIGLDLRAVLVGSEGTLGIVTRALVKLTPDPPAVRTLLLWFDDVADCAATVSGVIAEGVVPAALEMMDRPLIRAIENFIHADLPVDAAAMLLAEVSGHPDAVDAEAAVVERIGRDHGAQVRVAQNEEERAVLWKGRKSAFGAVAQIAPDYYLHDTVVPRTRLVEAMTRLYEIAERYDLTLLNTVHAGDGNLHPKLAFDGSDPEVAARVHAAGEEMVQLAIDLGGALSGEHGIGLEKRHLMGLVFGTVDLDAQARLREAFDPEARLNPHKVLPAGSRCAEFGRPVPEGTWV
ncbi:MAG TPA: FAD-linked oxidase C-terminal domain-containing protein [Acidimicrobiia bacterium]|nr:FAD-linked oxidase C-terminal domain-containing protein [Acidimicrobiia bacterium]